MTIYQGAVKACCNVNEKSNLVACWITVDAPEENETELKVFTPGCINVLLIVNEFETIKDPELLVNILITKLLESFT